MGLSTSILPRVSYASTAIPSYFPSAMALGPASVPLTPDGFDSEYAPFRLESIAFMDKLNSLPLDKFRAVGESIPPALPTGCPTREDDIDARHENVAVCDGTELDVLIYRPKAVENGVSLPVYFSIHAGAWVFGTHVVDEATMRYVCGRNQCVVISPEYRKYVSMQILCIGLVGTCLSLQGP